MLEITDLSARYGQAEVVRGVTLQVGPGEAVALVGDNGAGKTTLLRAVGGQHQARRGSIVLDGRDLSDASTVATARAGVVLVPQGRRLFSSLTVAEHVRLAETRRSSSSEGFSVDDVFDFFPQLAERRYVRAGSLSGGEQQMLAITRAVLQRPRYILLDEPTEGLSPSMVEVVSRLVTELPARGLGLLITEQTAGSVVLAAATRQLTMDRGALTGQAHAAAPAPQRAGQLTQEAAPTGVSRWLRWRPEIGRHPSRSPRFVGEET